MKMCPTGSMGKEAHPWCESRGFHRHFICAAAISPHPGTLMATTVTGRNPKGESQPTDPVTAAVP